MLIIVREQAGPGFGYGHLGDFTAQNIGLPLTWRFA